MSQSNDANLFSLDDIMEGRSQPLRRAQLNLFAIESRSARLAEQSRVNLVPSVTRTSSDERSRLFLDTLASDRDHDVHVTIQQIERFAPRWASLVPEAPHIRAEIAHMLGQEYRFTYDLIPRIRKVLGLDTEAVQKAYQDQHQQALEQIYSNELSRWEQFQWAQAQFQWRVEDLPPFWIAFAMTFTGTVGGSILALPIALAGVGPIAGVLILIVLGLVNILTLSAFVEAIVRNGTMRYGTSFLGKLVHDYLGQAGSAVLNITLIGLVIMALISYFIGLATTVGNALNTPPILWAGVLLVIIMFLLRGKGLRTTITVALLIAALNLFILILIMLLTLPHMQMDYLTYMRVPFVNNVPFDIAILQLIFGVVLCAYFGHTSAANAAKVVLERDPSGRSLLRGNIAAMSFAVLIYCLWLIVINGAIEPEILMNTTGTALVPIAALVGSSVSFLGIIYVILGLGINAIYYALALYNQIMEWLPQIPHAHTKKQDKAKQSLLLNPTVRYLLGTSPVVILFLIIAWMLLTGNESFTSWLGYRGVLTVPIMAGIFPTLLLFASRRKGDYLPQPVLRGIGHPIVQATLYLIFLASILLHGLFIYQHPLEKLAAILTSLAVVGVSFRIMRSGAFTARDILEIRVDDADDGRAFFKLVSTGKAHPVHVTCDYDGLHQEHVEQDSVEGMIPNFPDLKRMQIQLPATPAQELKLWTHRVTTEGVSESLTVHVSMDHHEVKDPIPMHEKEGIFILSIGEIGHLVELEFEH